MKELSNYTVEMLKKQRSEIDLEMTLVVEEIHRLDDKIKELNKTLGEKLDKYDEYNEVRTDICELIGYEEES